MIAHLGFEQDGLFTCLQLKLELQKETVLQYVK